jgi:hypothetical protein
LCGPNPSEIGVDREIKPRDVVGPATSHQHYASCNTVDVADEIARVDRRVVEEVHGVDVVDFGIRLVIHLWVADVRS